MRPIGKIFAWAAGGLIAVVVAGFGFMQTEVGKDWLASTATRTLSSPAATIKVGTIEGLVPFDMRISQIAMEDMGGAWLTIDEAAFAWSPSALLRGRLRIDQLTARSIEFLRQPAPSQTSGSSGFSLPRLPVTVELRNLAVNRLAIAPAVAGGDNAEASIEAHGLLTPDKAELSIELSRTDGQPGRGTLEARYDHPANALTLKLDINEPTGILLDASLARTDHLPLRVTLDGSGPLSGWQGRFHLMSGQGIHSDATVEIANKAGTRIALKGSAAISPLLTDDLRPLVGDDVKFEIIAAEDGKGGMMLAPSRIALATVTMDAQGSRSDRGELEGKLHIAVPDTSAAEPLLGRPAKGALSIDAILAGTLDRPKLTLTQYGALTFGDVAVDGLAINAQVEGKPGGGTDDPVFDLTIDAKAESLNDIASQKLYGPLSLHFAGTTDTKGALVDIGQITATGGGVDFKGAGSFKGGIADGKASLTATDLSIIGGMFGQRLGGAANIDVLLKTDRQRTVSIDVSGRGDGLRTGVPAADALLTGGLSLNAGGTRTANGKIAVRNIVLTTGGAKIEGNGGFDPGDRTITAAITATLADLKALSSSAANPLTGSGKLSAKIGGTLDTPSVDADSSFDHVALGKARIDHFDAAIHAPQGLKGIATLKGRIDSGKLAETIEADLGRNGGVYRLNKLRLAGTGGTFDAAMTVDPAQHRVAGKMNAAIGDLSVWSDAVGEMLAGQVSLALDLPADGARQGPISITVDRFSLGASPNSVGLTHAALTGKLSGDLARQNGAVDLSLAGLSANGGAITNADAHVSAKGKLSDFRLHAAGRAHDPISVDLAGSATEGANSNSIQIASFTAKLGKDTISLTKPATLTIAPQAYRLAGLGMTMDGGVIEGDAALSPKVAAADLRIRQLPLHPLAALAGRPFVGGTLDGHITLTGTAQRPEVRVMMATKGLDVQTDGPLPRPSLNLSAAADWRGERINLDAKITSGSGETLALTGSAPFAFDLVTLNPRAPRDPSLILAVKGGGRLENLSSIVPLGEDRIGGEFTIDIAVGGTIASPRPSGHVAITGGRYTNLALGTELDGIDLSLTSAGERFALDHMTATDSKSGKLNASGAVDLGRSPASVGFDLSFSDFLVARGDNMTVAADGDLKLTGTLKAMNLSGKLGIRKAELYIPDRLPASVVTLDVSEIGGRDKEEEPKAAPVAPVTLQIALDAPGQVFVRGHGVTSEWRGHIDIGGSTAQPSLTGQLAVNNGSIDLLGQNFNIDRGEINFTGGTTIDPVLNVQASAVASSVTALVNVTGTARAPKIALSSIPPMPQDEILARVLFGANVGSLTPSQGLQLAAAAATLAQGGPGIMDRVRSTIGLDRLDLGAGGANANGTQGVAKGTTVSGGKYIANGVFVGVAQGLGTNSSQAKVEVEITPNIFVNSTFGTGSGSGFGMKYSIDY
ncbi:MAG: translocation/assembly module TamB [Rhodospirillales bacterium]|nr:translocation/assembly module TamB [Rhodospirillales bacterium]